jgi:putative Mn2+ efflux pump MntP
MLSFIWLSILLGLDSFVISFALGPLVPRNKRCAIATAFGVCDAAAIVVGSVLGSPALDALAVLQDRPVLIMMIGYALYVTILARKTTALTLSSSGWLVLPIAACLDNLVARSLVSSAVPLGFAASVMAVTSATMSLAGLLSSETLRQRLVASPGRLAVSSSVIGAALLALVR